MSKYDVNINALATMLLPHCLRGSVTTAIIKVAAKPLANIGTDFSTYRKQKNYRIAHNSQVCYLRAVLNDKMSPKTRGFEVADSTDEYQGVFLNKREQNDPVVVSLREEENAVDIYCRDFGNTRFVSFTVTVPISFRFERLKELRSYINTYKLAGSRYNIKNRLANG